MRWGELAALRPHHVHPDTRVISVEETIVEVSKNSPTGDRYLVKPYPKDDEPRTLRVSQQLLDVLAARIGDLGVGPQDLLFPSTVRDLRQPMSRNTWRTRIWRPAVARAQISPGTRMHDLRHAHASAGSGAQNSPMSRARRTASGRVVTPSLRKILLVWDLTVLNET